MKKPVTLVTGASRGIGLATVHRLARQGHKVLGLSRTLPPAGTPCECFPADLEDAKQTEAILSEITSRHHVDNLVNNAGVAKHQWAGKITLETFDTIIAIHLRAALQCMQAVLPGMRARKHGRIVNIASRAMLGKEGRSAYGAAKAGLTALSRTWALETAADGITVNVVAPGPIATELFLKNPTAEIDRTVGAIPVKRMGTPEDVAAAIAFFLSEESGFITGQTLFVCGGLSISTAPM